MKILRHRKRNDGTFQLRIEVTPDDVREFNYTPKPNNMTQADYVAMQLRETKLLLEAEQAATGAGTKLPSEDTDL